MLILTLSIPIQVRADISCYPLIPRHDRNLDAFTKIDGMALGGDLKISQIEKIFGESKIRQAGDAGDYKEAICFKSSIDTTGIEFQGGELGINTLLIESDYHNLPDGKMCWTTDKFDGRLRIGKWIYLGMSESDLYKIGNVREVSGSKYIIEVATKSTNDKYNMLAKSNATADDDEYLGELIFQSITFSMVNSRVKSIKIEKSSRGIYYGDCMQKTISR